ncbi:MAG: hypothetical protein NTW21_12490 [Verrucomicrobia bacterium]|nr:hypothetical protein [Verrucomicrobiota bacterium]
MKQQAHREWWVILAGVMVAVGAARSEAAQAGAWETFFTRQNATAWAVYDDADGVNYEVFWSGSVPGAEYVYSSYTGDSFLSFWADAIAGGGALVGDYPAAKIAGIACDLYLEDLATLDFLDCSVYALGPGGATKRYYHSDVFLAEAFSGNGWWSVPFSFDSPWYYNNGSAWVPVNAKALTAIEHIDFNFYPVLGSAGGTMVGIDDVTLEPTLEAPPLATAVTTGAVRDFSMTFTPGPGLECRVEKMRVPPALGWDAVTGQTGIKGPGPHVFLTPPGSLSEIFRVAAQPAYTMIVTP